MRGKGVGSEELPGVVGITPAYAGKRPPCPGYRRKKGDHPRVCGEKSIWAAGATVSTGSPPRMRGKAKGTDGGDPLMGITPAYAGKSPSALACFSSCRDHPRVCGEKTVSAAYRILTPGSPPRMQGKVTSRTRRRTTAGRSSGACAATSNAHNGHQPKAIGLAAPHALTQQCPELLCIGHL